MRNRSKISRSQRLIIQTRSIVDLEDREMHTYLRSAMPSRVHAAGARLVPRLLGLGHLACSEAAWLGSYGDESSHVHVERGMCPGRGSADELMREDGKTGKLASSFVGGVLARFSSWWRGCK